MKRKFIVNTVEDTMIEEFVVLVPEGVNEKEAVANIEKAAKYATVTDCDDAADWDEHFDEMVYQRKEYGEAEAFKYYLCECCGYSVEPIIYDFSFEW